MLGRGGKTRETFFLKEVKVSENITQPEIPANDFSEKLKYLQPRQILMIDEAIEAVGEYGEVHLKVEKGRLKFLVTQTSHDALKYEIGTFENSA